MPKVDAKGRVVLPQAIREQLDIAPGTEVQVREEDGEVVIRPEAEPERILERLDRLVDEMASRREEAVPLDATDPAARRHRDAVRRGAKTDSEPDPDTGDETDE
ncbi:hypothetical protein DM2_3068 [Halorubrum sp. DM2]|uniref:AbrB/MazE/SpoVT family DNA-binding domain-containing protein n=1 Tax=Halorubrum sp. DM2 TaxID=2527867 RepID=UPI0024B7C88C|nr:AbrB/MazE/SpoVT family DNA-binding domain-containing protein [Halorubrum sp. DM2]VTT87030.1 hypothetical protein DM2_3068 [Halorubrum sp. DM2]